MNIQEYLVIKSPRASSRGLVLAANHEVPGQARDDIKRKMTSALTTRPKLLCRYPLPGPNCLLGTINPGRRNRLCIHYGWRNLLLVCCHHDCAARWTVSSGLHWPFLLVFRTNRLRSGSVRQFDGLFWPPAHTFGVCFSLMQCHLLPMRCLTLSNASIMRIPFRPLMAFVVKSSSLHIS